MPESTQIFQIRTAAGLTQAEAAELLAVSRSTFIRYETGKVSMREPLWQFFLSETADRRATAKIVRDQQT